MFHNEQRLSMGVHVFVSMCTGKSAFLFYVLYRLHSELFPFSSSSSEPPPSFKIIYHRGHAVLFTRDGVSSDMTAILGALQEPGSYYLFDAININDPSATPFIPNQVKAQVIYAHSPSHPLFEYRKLIVVHVYMPVWDYYELEIIRVLSFPHHLVKDFNELYKRWGGTARWTVWKAKGDSLREWQQSIDSMKINNANKLVGTSGGGEKADIAHRILHLFPSDDFSDPILDFASPLVGKRLFEKFITDKRNDLVHFMLANYKVAEYAATVGHFFELYCHRVFSVKDRQFDCKPLTALPANTTVSSLSSRVTSASTTSSSQISYTYTIPDLTLLEFDDRSKLLNAINLYAVPSISNFPAVDSLIVGPTPGDYDFIQATVSDDHGVKANAMVELINDLRDKSINNIFFAVPHWLYDVFPVQKYLTATPKPTVAKVTRALLKEDKFIPWAIRVPVQVGLIP